MNNRVLVLLIASISTLLLTGLTFNNKYQRNEPMELHSIMRLILMHVHTINEGIYTQNYHLIENGAEAINDHPPLSDESSARVHETLGDRRPAFGEFDNMVHNHADSIRFAAMNRDMDRVLQHYRIVQQGCVNCHVAFQDEIKMARLSEK